MSKEEIYTKFEKSLITLLVIFTIMLIATIICLQYLSYKYSDNLYEKNLEINRLNNRMSNCCYFANYDRICYEFELFGDISRDCYYQKNCSIKESKKEKS